MRSLKKYFFVTVTSAAIVSGTIVVFRETQLIKPLLKTAKQIYENNKRIFEEPKAITDRFMRSVDSSSV